MILVVTLAALAFYVPAYAAGPNTDMVVTGSRGLSGSVPWVNALYGAGQGPTFELAHGYYRNWYYPRYYRSYRYVPYYYGYSYSYPYARHFHHFRHSHHARFHRFH
jgi:hypothetical protein